MGGVDEEETTNEDRLCRSKADGAQVWGVGLPLAAGGPRWEPQTADCFDSAHQSLAQGLERAILSQHLAFGGPWARSCGV